MFALRRRRLNKRLKLYILYCVGHCSIEHKSYWCSKTNALPIKAGEVYMYRMCVYAACMCCDCKKERSSDFAQW